MNLNGEYITHRSFGRGQIVEHGTDFVIVAFGDTEQKKKFVYPAAIESFLVLEDAATSQQYKEYANAMAFETAEAQAAAAERQLLERKAMLEHEKKLKKAAKKPTAKKTVAK